MEEDAGEPTRLDEEVPGSLRRTLAAIPGDAALAARPDVPDSLAEVMAAEGPDAMSIFADG